MKNHLCIAYLCLTVALVSFRPVQIFAQGDMGAISLSAPVQKPCYGSAEMVSVRIRNFSATPHNFLTTPVTVTVTAAGPNPTSFTPVVVSTGTLAPGDSLIVVVSTNYNMSAAGTYIFNGSTTVTGDADASNNAMPSSSITATTFSILSTTPAERCGPGTLTLGATSTAGTTINWFTTAAGGAVMGTGNTFTTPGIASTTTYYAAAWSGGNSGNVGINVNDFPICGYPANSTATDKPLRFTTTRAVILNSVYIVPGATAVTLALRAYNSTVDIASKTFSFTAAQLGNPQQVNLDWIVATPGNYQLTNTVGGLWAIGNIGCGYPFTSPGGSMSITASAPSSTSISNITSYNGFYQINITEGCGSQSTAVVAKVNEITAIIQQPFSVSTCAGATVKLVVIAQGNNLGYQWRKDGVNIANANTSTLTINPASVSDAGNYEVVVTGLCGPTVTSNVAAVNIAAGNAWTGIVSSDWNNTANWCAGVPTMTSNVTVFAGTPFPPVINAGIVDVRSLTISTGATVTLLPNTTMNMYGDFVNNGTFSAAGASIYFKGTVNQTIGEMTIDKAVLEGNGITLNGNMTVNQTLTLSNGNLTLGINNITLNGSVTGKLNSHIVTNNTGGVITKNVSTTAVNVPVGPTTTSYNPVIISNGSGRDYFVRVKMGVHPPINVPGLAVNRTWIINPNAGAGPLNVNLTFQYEDAHMNTPGVATAAMDVGVHNGTGWEVVSNNVSPVGSLAARQVVSTTSRFGETVVANAGAFLSTAITSVVDRTMSSVLLLPNPVQTVATLRVVSTRYARVRWNVIDMNGRVVLSFDKSVLQGQNDIPLHLIQLPDGRYTITGTTDKGLIPTVNFIKQ